MSTNDQPKLDPEIMKMLDEHAASYKSLCLADVAHISLKDYGYRYDKTFKYEGDVRAMLRGTTDKTKLKVKEGIFLFFVKLGFTEKEARKLYKIQVPHKFEIINHIAESRDHELFDEFTDAVLNVKYYRNRRDWKKDFPVVKEFPYIAHEKFVHMAELMCMLWG